MIIPMAKTFARYQILKRIGGGNTGVVYEAVDPRSERRLALKILQNNFLLTKEKKARFLRELAAARILEHPALARIYEADEFEGSYYLAMEFVDGESYTEVITRQPEGVSLAEFWRLILPVVEGIACAHDHQLAHRDIKPDNLKLCADGTPKVLDFGLVKFLDGSRSNEDSFQTMAGMVIGSAGYMSPEQAGGRPLDLRTDVFSLGIVMYELCAGKNPFDASNAFATISKILKATPLSLELLRPDLPMELCQIILKCLKKDMQLRFDNAHDLLHALLAVKRKAHG